MMGNSSGRFWTLTASTIAVPTGIKTSIATATTAATYTTSALNGSLVTSNIATAKPSTFAGLAQYPTVTATNSVGSYTLNSTVVFVGTYGGTAYRRTATITSTAGNGTFAADGPLDAVTSIEVAAQANTSGAFTFGFGNVAPRAINGKVQPIKRIRAVAAGTIIVMDGSAVSQTLTFTLGQDDWISPQQILATGTATSFTVYE